MKLLIIPGGGDPEIQQYNKDFDLIRKEAEKRGFEEVLPPFKFPGHHSYSGNREFHHQKSAASKIEEKILELEGENTPYFLYCRSYGCGIGMELLKRQKLPNLKRIVLWGPVPILEMYKVTVFDREQIKMAEKEKGCFVNYESYRSCTPFEIQLLKYKGKHTVHIGAGSKDKYCKQPVFFDFLKDYIGERENIKYKCIKGLGHSVTIYNEEYMNLIFGEKVL